MSYMTVRVRVRVKDGLEFVWTGRCKLYGWQWGLTLIITTNHLALIFLNP